MSVPPASSEPKAPTQGEVVPTPCCFVLDEDSSVRHFVSLIMQGSGVDSEEFADSGAFLDAVVRRKPDVLFINVPLDVTEAAKTIDATNEAMSPTRASRPPRDLERTSRLMPASGLSANAPIASAAIPSAPGSDIAGMPSIPKNVLISNTIDTNAA